MALTICGRNIMRNSKTIVSGSSYDRGLEHLLKMWPDIIKEVPDAKLRIFYGWTLFDKIMANNPERMAWKEKMVELMKQPGITELGRISHGACEVEFQNAGIWAYSCHFGEISCITGMRAQAYGSAPVCTDYAALDETVQYGIKVKGDIYEPEIKEEFKRDLIDTLITPPTEEKRQEMMKWAREKFKWSSVAKQWDEEFRGKPSLDKQVNELMDNNQPLDAWELVKDTDYPKKDKVYAKVRHAFEPEVYKKFYTEDLDEKPVSEEIALDCTKLAPRFKWVVEEIERKGGNVVDIGCADGYLCLTLAKKGFVCVGVNPYKPSIDVAEARAEKFKLNVSFVNTDLEDWADTPYVYDNVVMFEVLEHLPDPKKAIDLCIYLLNKGGSFYLSTPSPEHVGIQQHKDEPNHKRWDEDGTPSGHLKLYNEQELRELLKGYNIKQMKLDSEKCWLVEVTK